MPEKLRKRRERLAQATSSSAERPAAGGVPKGRRRKVSRQAKTAFTSQLATLQDAGLPIVRSLRVLEGQMPAGPLKVVTLEIADEVESGSSLSEAMAKHPGIFDELYVSMVKAGETSGALTTIFNRLAEFMEKTEALIRQIRGAMIYPIVVLVVALGILTFIMVQVVPQFEDTFRQLGGDLPAVTRALIGTSRWMVENILLLLFLPVAIWGAYKLVVMTNGGRRFFHSRNIRRPLFGGIVLKSYISRFSRTLATLSGAGVPLMQALEICSEATRNVVVKEAIDAVREAVREGEPMARPMGETGVFDDIVVNMVDVGEETGELDRMLMRIADNNEAEVDTKVAALVSLLEPILIVIMAGIVGFIVIALFLPLLEIREMLGK
ncbi:MAG: type II secretion system F family protein [Planctomycetes bacterium]|nr:type II secretion system F family protein [Planctomycetota bacterium]